MAYLFDSKALYIKGLKYYKSKDYKTARMFFNSSLNGEFAKKAISALVKLDIKEGRYLDAKKRVINNMDSNSPEYYVLMALTNEIQYNYSKSLDLLIKADKYSSVYYYSKVKQAQVNLESGYFPVFCKMVDSLKKTTYYNRSLFLKSMYYILKKDYSSALNTLRKMDNKDVDEGKALIIESANFLIRYLLGNVSENDRISNELEHFKRILFVNDNSVIISHLKGSYVKDCAYSSLNFLPGINYSQLVEEAQERIIGMNPDFHNFDATYRMLLPNSVGIVDGREVNGLQVRTIVGTDKIIGMYPFEPCQDFDEDMESVNENLHRVLNLK